MKIQVTFESLEEFYQTFEGYNADGSLRLRRNAAELSGTTTPAVVQAAPKQEKEPEERQTPEEKPASATVHSSQEACRDILYRLNKQSGSNVAKGIIQAHGGTKLSDITDPEALEAIYAEAVAALNG